MKSVSKVVKNLDYVVNMGFIWLSADDVSIVAILNLIVAVLQFFLCFFFFSLTLCQYREQKHAKL